MGDDLVFLICSFLVSPSEMGSCFPKEVQFEEQVKGERKEMFVSVLLFGGCDEESKL